MLQGSLCLVREYFAVNKLFDTERLMTGLPEWGMFETFLCALDFKGECRRVYISDRVGSR